MTAPAAPPLKQCPMCKTTWPDICDLVLDPELTVEGYMADFVHPERGLVLLTHLRQRCGTSLAIRAEACRSLYGGPRHAEHRTGSERCPRLCLTREALAACHVDCDMAWVRAAIQCLHRHELPPHLAPAARD
jgi:hypothetical protein